MTTNMLPDGWSATKGPTCVGLVDEGTSLCGERAAFIGHYKTYSGCFCADCRDAIGDIAEEWRLIQDGWATQKGRFGSNR